MTATSADAALYPAAGAHEEHLVFHPNRHITFVRANGTQIGLRPPTLGEIRRIVAAYLAADEAVKDVDGRTRMQRLSGGLLANPDDNATAPYGVAFATVVHTLAGVEIAPDDLPLWAGSGELFTGLYAHWKNLTIVVEDAAPDDAATPPGGAGAVTPTADRPPGPDAGTTEPSPDPVVVFDPAAWDADTHPDDRPFADTPQPVTLPVAGGLGPRTPAGQAALG